MTVGEMIKVLAGYPPETPVGVYVDNEPLDLKQGHTTHTSGVSGALSMVLFFAECDYRVALLSQVEFDRLDAERAKE